MPTIDEVKKRRDEALQAWRREFKLLNFYEPGSPQWRRQRMAVENARFAYSQAANEYLEMLTKTERRDQGAA